MSNSETKTDKGTRKFQCNGSYAWGAVFSRLAGRGAREAVGTRMALAYAVAHEAEVASWGAKHELTTLGAAKPETKAPKASKVSKATRAKVGAAIAAAKATS